jgi:hypothetical protein
MCCLRFSSQALHFQTLRWETLSFTWTTNNSEGGVAGLEGMVLTKAAALQASAHTPSLRPSPE